MAIKQLPKLYNTNFRLPKRKPLGGVAVDRNNTYGKNVFAAWSFASRESWLENTSTRKLADLVGTSKSLAASDSNQNLRSAAGDNNHRLNLGSIDSNNPISLSDASTGGEYTIFFRCLCNDFTSLIPNRIMDKSDGGNAANGWMIQSFDNDLDVFYGGSVVLSVSVTGLSGVWLNCALTVKGGVGTFYVENSSSTGSVPSAPTATTNAAISNWNHSTNRNWDGDIAYIHMHYGAYSESQVKAYWKDPYQILKPKQEPVYFIADASGVLTIIPTSIPSGESFGTPTITTGVVLISPVAILTQESVGDPVIELILQQIFPEGIPTEEFVGRPVVLGGANIVIPVLSRQTWNAVAKYLRDLVFKGQDNDVILAWFRSEGLEDGAYNDLWYDYLLQKGFINGALTDKYAAWRQDIAGDDPWLLSSGSWNDNKIWRDNETWKDS
jgi:hypothetical protein